MSHERFARVVAIVIVIAWVILHVLELIDPTRVVDPAVERLMLIVAGFLFGIPVLRRARGDDD